MWLVQTVRTENPQQMNKPWAQRVGAAERGIRATLAFYFFLVHNFFFLPMVMFQNCLIKKMVFNKQSYSEKKETARAENSRTSGLMHNENRQLGRHFFSSKTEICTSRGTNTPCNWQVRLLRLVSLDVYMDTAWITQGLLQYNKSGKREARAAPVPELDNCLWCNIDVSSECRQCPKPPNSLSTYTIAVRGICRSIFSSFIVLYQLTALWMSVTQQHLDWSSQQCPTFTTVAVVVQHHRPGRAGADPSTNPAKAFWATFTLTLRGNLKSSSHESPNDYNAIEHKWKSLFLPWFRENLTDKSAWDTAKERERSCNRWSFIL